MGERKIVRVRTGVFVQSRDRCGPNHPTGGSLALFKPDPHTTEQLPLHTHTHTHTHTHSPDTQGFLVERPWRLYDSTQVPFSLPLAKLTAAVDRKSVV